MLDSEDLSKDNSQNNEDLKLSEGDPTVDYNTFRTRKGWKKSLKQIFNKVDIRSTKSNDGDHIAADDEAPDVLSMEQKWQSLGKIFRRQSVAGTLRSSLENQVGESSNSKRSTLKRFFTSYFHKNINSGGNEVQSDVDAKVTNV